jgi:serine phosphatase RsbU (regulator of sigma subunit)/PAS domain-containing protein
MLTHMDGPEGVVRAQAGVVATAEVLRVALRDAVAGLSGLGGLVHVCGSGGPPGLYLATSSGLPAALTGQWQQVRLDSAAAPAAAVRLGRPVWRAESWEPGTGMAAVPLGMPQRGAAGALTVVTSAAGEPRAGQWAGLISVATWAGELLEHARMTPVSRRAVIGTWAWDVASGELSLDDRSLAVFGIDPAGFDGHVQAWLSVVHPDDIVRVAAETDNAISTLGRCDTEFRVWDPDGTIRWIRVRGRIETDVSGQPCRMLGEAWDTTGSHAAAPVPAGRTAQIQELTAALAEAVTTKDVVAAVAERVLPPFGASGLLIETAEAGHLQVIGAVGYPRPHVEGVNGLPLKDIPSVAAALHDHRPFFISSAEEYLERFPELAGWPERSRKQAWAFMPLVVSGRAGGLCLIGFDQPRRLDGAERALLVALSGLIAQALERARLYDAEHARAQELQRALLPQVLPSLPAVTAAARYLPAGPHATIGGDWYDVISLSADRVALVIGDVMGHGLPEAVIMGRLRTAVQTLSDLDLPPDEILSHLNEVVNGLGGDCFATCLYAIYDPVARTCAIACAGHPPLALVSPDGTVRFCPDSADPPLGVAEPPFELTELPVPDQGLLILYTDGLIASAHADLGDGMSHLAGLVRSQRGAGLDQLCDTVTDGLLPGGQQSDDAALLAVRANRTPSGSVATWSLPEDPRAASAARHHIRTQLAAWHLDELAYNTELIASELIANVIRHAHGPIQLRLIRSNDLVCEVFDGSETTPRIRRTSWTDEGGRGLQLVAALSERWGTRYLATGKSIWTEQSPPIAGTAQLAGNRKATDGDILDHQVADVLRGVRCR